MTLPPLGGRALSATLACTLLTLVVSTADEQPAGAPGLPRHPGSPEVLVGERLFFETRFSHQHFAQHLRDVNTPPRESDPGAESIPTPTERTWISPFRGQSTSCRTCHLGDDLIVQHPFLGRTYAEFSPRSRVPPRPEDPLASSPRNAQALVGFLLTAPPPSLFHHDGEFSSLSALISETLIGRNFGWLPSERILATRHVAAVIRGDEGLHPRHLVVGVQGIPYRAALLGADKGVPRPLRVPSEYSIDVVAATDGDILGAVARFIAAYLESLTFGFRHPIRKSLSPYDAFLVKNGLPLTNGLGESDAHYTRRLVESLSTVGTFEWVDGREHGFLLHDQPFAFGPDELAGVLFFLGQRGRGAAERASCATCHVPPLFTDAGFHCTGVSQFDYDDVFGEGAFLRVAIPDSRHRTMNTDDFLPPSSAQPGRRGLFRRRPRQGERRGADLGLWNFFGNPDAPTVQTAAREYLCREARARRLLCSNETLLRIAIGTFKTPGLRDLGQSDPYFHSGRALTLVDAVEHYRRATALARRGRLRNAATELSDIDIDPPTAARLVAFLRSLNEDYQ